MCAVVGYRFVYMQDHPPGKNAHTPKKRRDFLVSFRYSNIVDKKNKIAPVLLLQQPVKRGSSNLGLGLEASGLGLLAGEDGVVVYGGVCDADVGLAVGV